MLYVSVAFAVEKCHGKLAIAPQTQKIVPYILVTRFELQILTSLYQNLSLHEEEVIYFHQLRSHSSKIFMSYHSKLTREIKKKTN